MTSLLDIINRSDDSQELDNSGTKFDIEDLEKTAEYLSSLNNVMSAERKELAEEVLSELGFYEKVANFLENARPREAGRRDSELKKIASKLYE